MDNGCLKCEEFNKMTMGTLRLIRSPFQLCLDCQLKQAKATVFQDRNKVEEIKQKIKQEQIIERKRT